MRLYALSLTGPADILGRHTTVLWERPALNLEDAYHEARRQNWSQFAAKLVTITLVNIHEVDGTPTSDEFKAALRLPGF